MRWNRQASDGFFPPPPLNGTAHTIGQNAVPGNLFTYRTGQMIWSGGVWWGIGFSLPVFQVHTQPMAAQ